MASMMQIKQQQAPYENPKPPFDILGNHCKPSFYFPKINCFLDLQIHPDYCLIKDIVDTWLIASFQPESKIAEDTITQWRIPLLMGLATPEGRRRKVILATQILAWMFVADDVLDDMTKPGSRAGRRLGISDRMICAVVEGNVDTSMLKTTAMRSFFQLWQEVAADMPKNQRLRFVQSMKDFFEAVRVVNALRKANKDLSVQEYINLRRISAGVYPSFILSEYALGVEQDEETVKNDLMKQLEIAAVDHIAWVNDLYSFRKEYCKGEWHSLPSLLCIRDGYELQESICKTSSMIELKEQEFTTRRNIARSSLNLRQKPGLLKYIKTLSFWMSGNLQWSTITARYHGLNYVPGHFCHGMVTFDQHSTIISSPTLEEKELLRPLLTKYGINI